MRKTYLPILLCLALTALVPLAGCAGKTVDVVQADQFKVMADRMHEELIARDILDKDRDYVSGLLGSGDANYGEILFKRLSPDFLFEDVVGGTPGNTFAAIVFRGDGVQKRPGGFTIRRVRQSMKVNMIAITDWDGDGKKDWIVSCAVDGLRGGKTRDYYVVIADPTAQGDQGPLKGKVAAVYESFGVAVAGKLYVRESAQKSTEAPASEAAPTVVEESVPGLRPVTTPPKLKEKGAKREGLEERNL